VTHIKFNRVWFPDRQHHTHKVWFSTHSDMLFSTTHHV